MAVHAFVGAELGGGLGGLGCGKGELLRGGVVVGCYGGVVIVLVGVGRRGVEAVWVVGVGRGV